MGGARKRRAVRAARRRAERTVENTLARERAQAATEAEEEFRPRVGRHVGQLDYLHMQGAISADQSKSGARFRRDFERSGSTPGRLVGRYEPNIRRPR